MNLESIFTWAKIPILRFGWVKLVPCRFIVYDLVLNHILMVLSYFKNIINFWVIHFINVSISNLCKILPIFYTIQPRYFIMLITGNNVGNSKSNQGANQKEFSRKCIQNYCRDSGYQYKGNYKCAKSNVTPITNTTIFRHLINIYDVLFSLKTFVIVFFAHCHQYFVNFPNKVIGNHKTKWCAKYKKLGVNVVEKHSKKYPHTDKRDDKYKNDNVCPIANTSLFRGTIDFIPCYQFSRFVFHRNIPCLLKHSGSYIIDQTALNNHNYIGA